MMRRPRRPHALPPGLPADGPRHVAFAPPTGLGGAPPSTPAQLAERRAFVEPLWLAGTPAAQIVDFANKQGKGWTAQQVRNTLAELRSEYAADYADRETTRRTDQLARLHRHLALMSSTRPVPHSAIATTEKLIAEIEGNLAPRRLQVEQRAVPDALAAVCAGMSEAEVERLLAEERERELRLGAVETTGAALPESP